MNARARIPAREGRDEEGIGGNDSVINRAGSGRIGAIKYCIGSHTLGRGTALALS
jgi:hypothetical protein